MQGFYDTIIAGQGLAGTTLAWHLHEAGQRVLMIDAGEPSTSSRIAAGLITPITGRNLALSWRCAEFLPVARAFYPRIEARTGRRFFHERRAARLFVSQEEAGSWVRRSADPAYLAHLTVPQASPLLDPELGEADAGGFEMHAAQLDVAAYLEASRAVLPCETMTLDWRRDITFGAGLIDVRGLQTRRLISCEGYGAAHNPYFDWLPMKGAKGEVLTVRFHRTVPARTLHRGIWIAPTAAPDVFRVGATYDLVTLDGVPTAAGRAEIERKLTAFFGVPYTVLDQKAAVRPIVRHSRAAVGLHPGHAQLGYFNGLGSKGALHAPWFAGVFARHLVDGVPLPEECDIARYARDYARD